LFEGIAKEGQAEIKLDYTLGKNVIFIFIFIFEHKMKEFIVKKTKM
jgi:hypothetical protein